MARSEHESHLVLDIWLVLGQRDKKQDLLERVRKTLRDADTAMLPNRFEGATERTSLTVWSVGALHASIKSTACAMGSRPGYRFAAR